MAVDKKAELSQLVTQELISILEIAAEKSEGNSTLAVANTVELCLESIASSLAKPNLDLAKIELSKYSHALSVEHSHQSEGFLSDVHFLSSSLNSLVEGSDEKVRATPQGLLLSLMHVPSSSSRQNLVNLKQCLLRASITADQLLQSSTSTEPANQSFVYAPLDYGEDLTSKVESGKWKTCPLIGMRDELRNVMRNLPNGSVCLMGEKGVGKSALVQGLAWHLVNGTQGLVRPKTQSWRIVSITRADLVAGTSDRGSLEKRLKQMLEHFRATPTAIPFFDEVHAILNAKDDLGSTVINILKPPMADGSFRILAATTDAEYGQYIMPDEALSSRFRTVFVAEPLRSEAIEILTKAKNSVIPEDAEELGVELDDELIPKIVDLTNKYRKNDSHPRKGFQLLKAMYESKCYDVDTAMGGEDVDPVIDQEYLQQTAQELFGISLNRENEDFWFGFVEKFSRVFPSNKDVALEIAAYLLRQSKGLIQLDRGERAPCGIFVFAGGSSAMHARIRAFLQNELFSDPSGFYYENMAQFSTDASRYKLVGAPPGYVGHEDTRETTVLSKIKRRPQGGIFHLGNFSEVHESLLPDLEAMFAGEAKDSLNYSIDLSQWIVLITISGRDGDGILSLQKDSNFGPIFSQVDLAIDLDIETFAESVSVEELLEKYRARSVEIPQKLLKNLDQLTASEGDSLEDKFDDTIQEHFKSVLGR